MIELALGIMALVGVIVGAILTFVNVRRSNDLKKIELDQAAIKATQEEEARKRRDASDKHATDMQKVAALEERLNSQADQLDRLRGKFGLLWAFCLELMTHIAEGKPPPPPPIPPELLE